MTFSIFMLNFEPFKILHETTSDRSDRYITAGIASLTSINSLDFLDFFQNTFCTVFRNIFKDTFFDY